MPALLYFIAVIILVFHLLTSDDRIYLNPTSRNELLREKDKIELVCGDGSTALLVPDWEADTNYQYVCPYKKSKGGFYFMTMMVFGLAILTDICSRVKYLVTIGRKGREMLSKGLSKLYKLEPIGELIYSNRVYIQLVGMLILIILQYI